MKPFFPALVWAAIILGLSVCPSVQLPTSLFSSDKLSHLAAYGLLNWLLLGALSRRTRLPLKSFVLATMAVAGYGILLEVVQWAFFPSRFFEILDMAANFVGAFLSGAAFYFFQNKKGGWQG